MNERTILAAAKPAFGESTEASALAELIDSALRPGPVNWLEIGAGDGRNLNFLIETLSNEREIRAVAIEPAGRPASELSSGDRIEWVLHRAEQYVPDREFNWVNVRHSAYYFDEPVAQLRRSAHWLGQGATLSLTHWCANCILYRLHLAICRKSGEKIIPDIEGLAANLSTFAELRVSEPVICSTDIDIDLVQRDASVAVALYELARRGRSAIARRPIDRAEFVREALRGIRGPNARQNGLLLISRR